MNRKSIILCSAALASLTLLLPAESPVPEKPIVVSITDAARLAEAEAAVQREVIRVVQVPSPADRFSRTRPITSSMTFTMAVTDSAPQGVLATPAQVPFAVYRTSARALGGTQAIPEVFLSGYFDANSKSVQLYSTAAQKYVAAAEHPYIKARTPKKP